MCIAVFCSSDGVVSRTLSVPLFDKLGAMSIAIYMSHGFVLYFTQSILDYSLAIYIIFTLLVVLLFSFILDKYYVRHMKNYIIKLFSKI